jgi:hypothetical protein
VDASLGNRWAGEMVEVVVLVVTNRSPRLTNGAVVAVLQWLAVVVWDWKRVGAAATARHAASGSIVGDKAIGCRPRLWHLSLRDSPQDAASRRGSLADEGRAWVLCLDLDESSLGGT